MTTPNIRELRRQRAQRHAGTPLLLKLLIVCGGLYVLYVLAGFFLAPSLLKSQIEKRASAQLKREVQVDHVAFNPFTLSMRIDRLLVRDHDGQPLVGWRQLFFNFQVLDLVSNELHFSEIELDGFASRIFVSKQGILNISDIIPSAPPPTKSDSRWSLRIDRLAVNRAELDYSDASRPEPFATHVGPTTFVLRDFRTTGGPGAPGVFTATTEAGETIAWTGRVALAPLRSNGELRIGQLALKKYSPFYSAMVNFDVLGGTVDAQVPYEFTIENNKPQLKVMDAGAQVHALQLAERGKSEPVVSLIAIDASHASCDLQASTAEVRQVALTGGRIAVRRDTNGINLLALMPPSSAAAPTASSTADATPAWRAQVDELSGKDLAISVNDRTTPRPGSIDLNHVTFSVKHFSTADLSTAMPVDFRTEISPGSGTLHVDGQAALKPLSADLSFALESGSAMALSPWAETFADILLTQGVIGVRGQVHVAEATGGALAISAKSEGEIGGLAVTDGRGEPLAGWKSLSIKGAEYTSNPARLSIAEISLADPEAQVVMGKDHKLNVSNVLRQSSAPKTVTVGPPAAPSQFIAIDRIALANAKIEYVDQSIEPNVKTSVDQLSGTITGLTSAAIDRADLDLNGRVAGTAPLSIRGKVNVLSEQLAADIRMELKDSDLAPVAPYVGKFVGFKLDSGAVSVDAKAKVNNNKLDSTSNVVITNFTLGDATNSPDAPHVPVHLALALLRDKEGKITLDLPVQGSLDDPNFEIGGVVMKVVANLITKAATSPFSLIGAMFGGGKSGDDLAFQDFPVGSSELPPQGMQKLDIVAKALRERPALHLAITGRADPATDLAALRDQELERRIRVAVWEISRKGDPTLDSPDKVGISREDADKALGLLYRDAFMQPPPEAAAAPTPVAAKPTEEPRRGFFLFRWFSRSKPQPPPAVAHAPAAGAAQPTGPATVKPSGPVIAAEYGKVIGSEYGTVIGAPPGTTAMLPPPDEMRRRLLDAIPAGDTELRKLAVDRAEQVRGYLTTRGAVAPDRVDVVASEIPPKGGTRVTLDLR